MPSPGMSDIRLNSSISQAPQCRGRGLVVAGRVRGSEPAEVGKTPVVGDRSDTSDRGVGLAEPARSVVGDAFCLADREVSHCR